MQIRASVRVGGILEMGTFPRGPSRTITRSILLTQAPGHRTSSETQICPWCHRSTQMKELMKINEELNARRSSFNPMFLKCDLRETVLSPELFGTKFDAIFIDPPMEEYVRRAPGVLDPEDYWTWEQIKNLRIEDIAASHSFVFLWVVSDEGLKEGRRCFKKWGFRRDEDICWLETNHENLAASASVNNDFIQAHQRALFDGYKKHYLTTSPNIDVDVIVSEEPPYGSTLKPEYLYRIIEHLVQGRRRIEIFGDLQPEGNLSKGGYGCPAPLAPHFMGTIQRIEELRPKSSSSI